MLVALAACGGEAGTETAPVAPAPTTSAAPQPGVPPVPDDATTTKYIAALKRIDPDIVGDKDDRTMVNRGRDQCTSIAEAPDDTARLIKLTNQRFTSPEHPDGFGTAKATKILAAVREYICP
ncbi:hypothetical protein JQN84_13800 [Micromonospora sp. MMS20-R2-29]|uniref:DUF732 domain-containing protein n=1 Tax=Micromonospora humidisoli TaxID=2807622 RepID=A0ABS2JBN0_9ACTN|nr:hypothetical protein [Micromonospora humidisoli]